MNVAAAVDVLSCAIAPNGPVVVGVATAAVVLETDIFVGAFSDLVEIVFWAVGHFAATAVVYIVYSCVCGTSARKSLDGDRGRGAEALPIVVEEIVGCVRELDPFLAAGIGVGISVCRRY